VTPCIFIEGVIIIKYIDGVFKVKIWVEFRADHSSVHQCCNHDRKLHCKFMLVSLVYWVYTELPDIGTRLTTQRQRKPNNKTWRRTAELNIYFVIVNLFSLQWCFGTFSGLGFFFSETVEFFKGEDCNPTPNPHSGGPEYISISGTSLKTCLT